MTISISPVKHRHVVLDALRGFALLGICLANFPEFSLYTFQPDSAVDAMPSAAIDRVTNWLMIFFVDGKFYTIFSILFGIGFSIILNNAREKGINGNRLFFRRMTGLAVIGLLHLMLLWSGDILLLYALMGMLLPFFMKMKDRNLLLYAALFLILPVIWDFVAYSLNIDPAKFAYDAWWHWAAVFGITEENFGTWLRDADTYGKVWAFLVQGACERLWEFVDSSRYFKVLGLFLIGAYIGRHRVYARLDELKPIIVKVARIGFAIGLPLSVVYAMYGFGETDVIKPLKSLVYLVSVYPLGIAYCALFSLLFLKTRKLRIWRVLANPGRMALTNYVGQSVFGIILFYGIGLGLGASLGLTVTVAVAFGVFVCQTFISGVWLHWFKYGPLEWLWRMWNYGHFLTIKRQR